MKVFCLPPAGGGAFSYYNQFVQTSDANVEFIPLEYPGHGTLLKKDMLEDMNSLVRYATGEMEAALSATDRFMIMGHSMGGMLAYEAAHYFVARQDKRLERVFFCGCASPNYTAEAYHDYVALSDDEFMERVHALGGVTEEMMGHQIFREVFLKRLRADFKIISDYFPLMKTLRLPACIMIGEKDVITLGKYRSWKMFCSNVVFHSFSGGHFFVVEEPSVLEMVYTYAYEAERIRCEGRSCSV